MFENKVRQKIIKVENHYIILKGRNGMRMILLLTILSSNWV